MRTYILLLIFCLLCSACTLGPDFKHPQPPVGKTYTSDNQLNELASQSKQSGTAQSLVLGKDIAGQWWTLFQSPALNKLIERAIAHSPDIQATLAALTQAQETTIAQQSALLPSVDASYAFTRQKTSGASFGQPNFGSLFTLNNASVKVSYTLDVFGAIRRQIEGLEAQADYQRFQLEAAFLSLTANIVTTVVQEASVRAQLAATEDILRSQIEQLNVIQQQVAVGAASELDIMAQKTQVAQTRTTLPPLQLQLEQLRHQLTILVGEVPSYPLDAKFSLADLKLPKELPLSLPSKLLEQRPDIRAQEAMLHVASAQIGVAAAAMFPNITLTAGMGTVASQFGNLLVPGSGIWNTGLNLLQPVFHGGQLIHQKRATLAAFQQAGEEYRSTVLKALQNVADTLSALQLDATELNTQNVYVQLAQDTLELTRAQYQVGAVSYLSLLSAQSSYQQSRLGQVKALAARYADTAALFQALGGGWWNRNDLQKNKVNK